MSDFDHIEPLQQHALADYHMHCDYSIDAEGTIDEYCQAALQRGLAEICFTTHYDTNPKADGKANQIRVDRENRPANIKNLEPYVHDVLAAAEKFHPLGLLVKLGVEVGYHDTVDKTVAELKQNFDFEYYLCGVHELNDTCFCCKHSYKKCFESLSVDEAVKQYVAQLVRASDMGVFNTIAHLDYIRKYGLEFYGDDLDRALLDHMPALFDAVKKNGTALEINTAGLRKDMGSYFPSMPVFNAARRAGVQFLYLGSDAHRPQDVGYDFDAAAALVPQAVGGCESF